jgi:hypothetical protein
MTVANAGKNQLVNTICLSLPLLSAYGEEHGPRIDFYAQRFIKDFQRKKSRSKGIRII